MKKKRVKNWVKVLVYSFLLFFTSVFIIVSASLLYRSLNPEAHKDNLLVSYNSEDNISYKIKTKENSFYSDSDMNMNKQYISAIIDKIIFDVSYEYNASKLLDYEYDYSIVATLVGDYKSQAINSELWNEEFIIEPKNTYKVNNENSILINKTFEIDYQTYNSIMANFQKEFNLDVDAYLKIAIDINVKSTTSDINQIETYDDIDITIPLLKDTTYVKYEKTGVINDNVWTVVTNEEHTNTLFKLMYGFGLLVGIILDVILMVLLLNLTTKDRYFYEINKIFKKYDKVLANVETIPRHDNLIYIRITNFKDMLDINKEMHVPILYCEAKNKVDFVILTDVYFYIYTIKRDINIREKM